MKISPLLGLSGMLLLYFFGCTEDIEKKAPESEIEVLRTHFSNPPSEYRSAPLWDWNEQITEEGIDFQMREFKKAGIGGVFVHPRPGLLTEYLSDEWFHLFDFTVKKGKELDMKVWIYDENSYPSGFAGGHVPAEMPDSYMHGTSLQMVVQETVDELPSEDIVVVLKKEGELFRDITASLAEEKGREGTYYVFEKAYAAKSPWYGGFSYVDLLYEGVTDKFIQLTMSDGYENFKSDFGHTLPGIFTDEPNLEAAMASGSVIRWTPDLFEEFLIRWGYDLRKHLPSLVEETGNWQKVRHDYYELLLELFLERWAKPWSRYCDANKLEWTGHYWEHGWPEPTHGFDEAAFYIWHQMPGVDMLGNKLDTLGLGGQFGNDRAVRELRSAANQAGRRRTLSETYGGGGWELDFEEQKRLVDWECVLGVNFVNQHLSYYSLNGVRKFDYPPSFSYHEPWWGHYKLLGDYIGRVCLATSLGEQINTTLVLQPTTTAWMYFSRKVTNPAIQSIRYGFKHFIWRLEQQHLEYDLGSENVIHTLGKLNGTKLRVGQRDYSLLVIPAEMENMDSPTVEILSDYLENGGKVLSFKLNVHLVDGAKSGQVYELAKAYPEQWTDVEDLTDARALNLLRSSDFHMDDKSQNGMLYHQRRVLNDGQILFVVNSSKTLKAKASISLPGEYLIKLDLVSGEEAIYPAKRENGKLVFDLEVEPAGSALFAAIRKNPGELKHYIKAGPGQPVSGSDTLIVKRESDNILMVNYLDIKTNKSNRKDTYFMDALVGLFEENGVEIGNPWQHKIQYKKRYLEMDSVFTDKSGFEVNYQFRIHENLENKAMQSIRAVVERQELWSVDVNGNEVEPIKGSYWIERDFSLYEVGSFLKKGDNTITLKAPRMHILAEVMPVYLLGDFLVTPAHSGFEISGGDISGLGSWREKGLPFYSQEVAYTRTFTVKDSKSHSYKVVMKDWKGSVSEVWVNGKAAGNIAWQPNECDVTDLLIDGDNDITIQVIGSLKNTFGFFYHDNTSWIHGPHSWNNAPDKTPPSSDYFLLDYGLFKPFELVAYERNQL